MKKIPKLGSPRNFPVLSAVLLPASIILSLSLGLYVVACLMSFMLGIMVAMVLDDWEEDG